MFVDDVLLPPEFRTWPVVPPEIRAEPGKDMVWVDGRPVHGGIANHRTYCHVCGTLLLSHFDYDAQFCPCCNLWVKEKCGHEECEYCADRPERPLPSRRPA